MERHEKAAVRVDPDRAAGYGLSAVLCRPLRPGADVFHVPGSRGGVNDLETFLRHFPC